MIAGLSGVSGSQAASRPGSHFGRWASRSDGRRRTLRFAGSLALFCWFAYWSWDACKSLILDPELIGIDGRIYYHGAASWLAGGDPWNSFVAVHDWAIHFNFAGPPPTLLAFAPATLISEDAFVLGWLGLSLAAGRYVLRRLHLPIWWLLFPPLSVGMLSGNPQIVCLALLLSGSSWLRALAAPMKAYAVLPLIGERRWRALAILVGAGMVSLVIFRDLWLSYLQEFGQISATLDAQSLGGFSATIDPRLFAVTALAIVVLAVLDRRAAGWLIVPALWPSSQLHYSTLAMPVMTPWLSVGLAVVGRGLPPVVICVYVAWRVARPLWALLRLRTSRMLGLGLAIARDEDYSDRPGGHVPMT